MCSRPTETSAPLSRVSKYSLFFILSISGRGGNGYLRAEEPALSGEDCDEDLVHLGYLTEELGEAEVGVLGHGVEFLLIAEGDDGDSAAHLEGDDLLGVKARHDGSYFRVVGG